MIPELLYLALEFYREPRRFDDLRNPRGKLPPGLTDLLAAPAHSLSDEHIASTAQRLGAPPEDCRKAVNFFIRQVLLEVNGDYYRTLGLAPTADQAQVKEHYFYLMRLFHPDKEVEHVGWEDEYAARINEAYNTLRKPAKRAAYDEMLAAKSGEGFGEIASGAADAAPVAPAPAKAPPAKRTAAPAFLRSPLFYAALVACPVVVLLVLLRPSDNTAQLRVTEQPPEAAERPAQGYQSLDELRADLAAEAMPSGSAVERDVTPASVEEASDAEIEAMVQQRVARATQAVLGASRPVSKALAGEVIKTTDKNEERAVSRQVSQPEPAAPPELAQLEDTQRELLPGDATEQAGQQATVIALAEPAANTSSELNPAAVAASAPVAHIDETNEIARQVDQPVASVAVSREQVTPVITEAPVVEAAPAVIAAAAEREPEVVATGPAPIGLPELSTLMDAFVQRYEAGDSLAFAELFAANTYTTDAQGRAEVGRLYGNFFATTRERTVVFQRVQWGDERSGVRQGNARVLISSTAQGSGERSEVPVDLRFDVARSAVGALEITRMTY